MLVLITAAAFAASLLTLYTGFGLATILMPVFAIFFPVQIAVAATAVVHLAGNIFRLALVGKHANLKVFALFALPAVVAAVAGASLLNYLSLFTFNVTYIFFRHAREVEFLRMVIGGFIVVFALLEVSPTFAGITLGEKYIPLGGAISGFFGGLSGNQGAFRSMFLIRSGLTGQEFVGTAAASSAAVDIVRLLVYGTGLYSNAFLAARTIETPVACAIAGAFLGTLIGARFIKAASIGAIQAAVTIGLVAVGAGMILGIF